MNTDEIKTAAERDALEWVDCGDDWRLKSDRYGWVARVSIRMITPAAYGWSTWEESGPETGEAGKRLAEDSARRLINEEDEGERREAGVGVLG